MCIVDIVPVKLASVDIQILWQAATWTSTTVTLKIPLYGVWQTQEREDNVGERQRTSLATAGSMREY